MKKLFFTTAAFLLAVSAHAEIIQRDTIPYNGEYHTSMVQTENKWHEITTKYYVVIENEDGSERRVSTDTKNFERLFMHNERPLYLIYTTNDKGNRRLAKAITK